MCSLRHGLQGILSHMMLSQFSIRHAMCYIAWRTAVQTHYMQCVWTPVQQEQF